MKAPQRNRLKRIAIMAAVSGEAGRAYLSGAFSFVNEHRNNWTIEVFDRLKSAKDRLAEKNGLDGAIIMTPHAHLTLGAIRRSGTPTVIVDFPPPDYKPNETSISFVRLNDEAIGIAAAEHFLACGRFNSFVCFIDEPQYRYPHVREAGFRKRLSATKSFVKTLVLPTTGANQRELKSFNLLLDRLPRPLGVFAVRDRAAPRIYDYCKEFDVSIPDEIAILGVDNDEIFCNTLPVHLSSILPDHWQIGYLAAKELCHLMRGGHGRDTVYGKSIKTVVQRASTRIIPPAAKLIADMLDYIEENASGSLRVSDVANAIGVSRRLADLRFRQSRGETILTAICRARIRKIKKALLTQNASIAEIARNHDFSSPAALTRFFRQHTKTTPGGWARQRS